MAPKSSNRCRAPGTGWSPNYAVGDGGGAPIYAHGNTGAPANNIGDTRSPSYSHGHTGGSPAYEHGDVPVPKLEAHGDTGAPAYNHVDFLALKQDGRIQYMVEPGGGGH
ncbi:hypothetical protein ABES33_28805 [Bacillus pseudomycoides]|uniref:hypothetical protein n=1 Tax=Bacillus pseudomycoides TaxID=64104 RepID=UPI003D1B126A